MQPSDSITNKLIDDGLRGLKVVDNSGSFTHQPRAGVVQRLVIDIVRKFLKVVFNRDDTLLGKFLNIGRAVLFPVLDIWVVANAEWPPLENALIRNPSLRDMQKDVTYSKDNRADVVVKPGGSNGLLVGLWSTGFFREDEAGSNPYSGGTKHKSCSHRLAVEETSGSNDLNRLAVHWALLALDHLNNGGDEDSCGDISGVATSLSSLSANDIHTSVKALLDVLRVADHVHIEDTSGMQTVNDMLWWDTNSRDKEAGFAFDDNINKLVQLALRVVVASSMLVPTTDTTTNRLELTWSCVRFLRPAGGASPHRKEHSCHSSNSSTRQSGPSTLKGYIPRHQ